MNRPSLVPDAIVLTCVYGTLEVRGWRVGKLFAVHGKRGNWTLTHTPSGTAVGWFTTRAAAVALALDFITRTPAEFWRFKKAGGLERKARAMPNVLKTVHRLRAKHGQKPIVPVTLPGVEYGKKSA